MTQKEVVRETLLKEGQQMQQMLCPQSVLVNSNDEEEGSLEARFGNKYYSKKENKEECFCETTMHAIGNT